MPPKAQFLSLDPMQFEELKLAVTSAVKNSLQPDDGKVKNDDGGVEIGKQLNNITQLLQNVLDAQAVAVARPPAAAAAAGSQSLRLDSKISTLTKPAFLDLRKTMSE